MRGCLVVYWGVVCCWLAARLPSICPKAAVACSSATTSISIGNGFNVRRFKFLKKTSHVLVTFIRSPLLQSCLRTGLTPRKLCWREWCSTSSTWAWRWWASPKERTWPRLPSVGSLPLWVSKKFTLLHIIMSPYWMFDSVSIYLLWTGDKRFYYCRSSRLAIQPWHFFSTNQTR